MLMAAESRGGQMANPGEPVYVYDDSPARPSDPPVNPLPEPGSARPRPPKPPKDPEGRSFRWPNPHPARKLGDGLVFLTGADRDLIGSPVERARYITLAVLMVIAAVQAWYTGTTFMSVGLSQPFSYEVGFGLFFAAAVFAIDRSIIGFAAPFRLRPGTDDLAPPKKMSPALFIRIGVAIIVALLMSETLLLRVFAGDIGEQIQANQLAAKNAAVAQIKKYYTPLIDPLQDQINDANNTVSSDAKTVAALQQKVDCQQTGCMGFTAGEGPGWREDKAELNDAQAALGTALAEQKSVTATIQPQIDGLESDERTKISQANGPIDQANKFLSREEAFWQLTVKYGAVAATRLLLSLLLLGIDLAPLLTKLTGRTSIHDKRAYEADYDLHREIEEHRKSARDRREARGRHDRNLSDLALADELAAADRDFSLARLQAEANADVVRARTAADAEVARIRTEFEVNVARVQAEADTELARAREEARVDLERYKVLLNADERKSRLYQDYRARLSPPVPDSPLGGGNGGPPGSNGHPNGNGYPNGNGQRGNGWPWRFGRPGADGADRRKRGGEPDNNDVVGFEQPPGWQSNGEFVRTEPPAPAPPPTGVAPPRGVVPRSAAVVPPVWVVAPAVVVPPVAPAVPPANGAPPPVNIPVSPAKPFPADRPPVRDITPAMARPPQPRKKAKDAPEVTVLDGKWVLRGKLAEADCGSGGTVRMATKVGDKTGREYVVKRVPADQNIFQRRLMGHERRAGNIKSRHVVEIVAYGETEDWIYVVSPLYRPGSLYQHCGPGQHRPDLVWCARVIAEVLSGLMDASKLGLTHLDIKPQNIVLDGEHARLIDWGLSRKWNAPETSRPMPGTAFYACPEQVIPPYSGLDSPLADLYGVGATFYWLITGEPPLLRQVSDSDGQNQSAEYFRLLREGKRPKPVHDLVPAVPRELSDLISRWLNIKPADRILPGTEAKNGLRAARDELGKLLRDLPAIPVGRVTVPLPVRSPGDARGRRP